MCDIDVCLILLSFAQMQGVYVASEYISVHKKYVCKCIMKNSSCILSWRCTVSKGNNKIKSFQDEIYSYYLVD